MKSITNQLTNVTLNQLIQPTVPALQPLLSGTAPAKLVILVLKILLFMIKVNKSASNVLKIPLGMQVIQSASPNVQPLRSIMKPVRSVNRNLNVTMDRFGTVLLKNVRSFVLLALLITKRQSLARNLLNINATISNPSGTLLL